MILPCFMDEGQQAVDHLQESDHVSETLGSHSPLRPSALL